MINLLKRYEVLVIRLQDRIVSDIFASTRLRITLLYFLMSILLITVAGALLYNRTLRIFNLFTRELKEAISASIEGASFPSETSDPALALENVEASEQKSVEITNSLDREIKDMIMIASLWLIVVIVISSYVFAGITLKPIKRALENRKQFIGNVSHELRTPLSIMKTSSEATLLDEADVSREELIATLKSNLEEADRMSSILQFLLKFSRFENRLQRLTLAPVNLAIGVKKAVQALHPVVERKRLRLKLSFDDDIFALGDVVALEEVILNLIKNAVRYTPDEGLVLVRLEKRRYGVVTLIVKDCGIGISEKDLPHVFEPFYRGGNAGSETKTRSGLGLSIVKEIVGLHRGTIVLKSKVGHGTVVIVRLPAASLPSSA